jgi:acyl transferase domain-containing protein/acyl carrier protein/nucleoside-diphosphate-sugar epimerase/SAM-dependent methyltransferase
MQQQLRKAGIMAAEVALRGRFHWEQYSHDVETLVKFCDSDERFQLPEASKLAIPTRSNSGGAFITQGRLHHVALRAMLIEQPQWHRTFSLVRESSLKRKESRVISFGPERCIPPSILRGLNPQVMYMADINLSIPIPRQYSENDIAVIGMSCKVAGADNLEEFWRLLCEGKSQHKEVPKERFGFDSPFREPDPKRKWFGNFIDDYDKFDHRFFKKSPREIASTDPQQRHLLQIAYQAVEQSGYFRSPDSEKSVGCYVGVCAVDYENNVACHAPNAFSATGNLRGFIAGKISHYFGWTGPGLTIDSACSSSAVAVHQACQALLSGECTAALAAGTHVMTSSLWFQNLAGASFLSPTGACKPFDEKADGYCRGEGVAAVFLKKMSAAIMDGDQILGTIAGTAVQQNQNCTPIFVPNAPSLSDLFRVVSRKAQLAPQQITVVEAHGTGTAVGDPAEYESVRQVLGGSNRSTPLMLSSVKGLVGHIECTSGLISLIKVLLMIQKSAIPPQASFDIINPAIQCSPSDNMVIPTSLLPWNTAFKAALINNYGASGSNASIVVTQAPHSSEKDVEAKSTHKYPFWFSGLDDRSLRAYSTILSKFLRQNMDSEGDLSLSNLSFNVSRQSNRALDRCLQFSCCSVEELEQKLSTFKEGDPALQSRARPAPSPVILCFGGQNSTFVGLDEQIYHHVEVFRKYLDECNAAFLNNGAGSIFPGIFQRSPIENPVLLQTMLFATQYTCAKSWIECGAQPVAVIGHSFGELTALCISSVLTLDDTAKMIIARAEVIRDSWGLDTGAMIAVEADLDDVQRLLHCAHQSCPDLPAATIACFNGPRNFTLAGSTRAIDAVSTVVSKDPTYSSMRTKRLNVTNAFHSTLVEPLMAELEEKARGLRFRNPKIALERATEFPEQDYTEKFVADHMRNPVYFNHAVQRLAKKYPPCIWLEAGSNSTIAVMASRALGSPSTSTFQSLNLNNKTSLDSLTEATLCLWKAGLRISFWAHHDTQASRYSPIILPPYQFEKARHWIELKAAPTLPAEPLVQKEVQVEQLSDNLLTFVSYKDSQNRSAKFRVNTMIPKYKRLVSGHVIAQTAPICPATVQIDLAIEGLLSLRPGLRSEHLQPQIHGVENRSPICVDPSRSVWLELTALEGDCSWNFQLVSTGSQKGSVLTTHTTGQIILRSTDELQIQLEFARYERLVGHHRCLELLNHADADDIIQGRNVYKTFSEIVDYGEDYQGLQKLVGKGNESAGRVTKKYNSETWLDAHLSDCFCQVGGIWVNCMTDRATTDIYIANGIEQWIRSPKLHGEECRPETWNVFATHHGLSDKAFLTDIFIFNANTGALMEVIMGINYVKVPKASMSKLLSRLTAGNENNHMAPPSKAASLEVLGGATARMTSQKSTIPTVHKPKKEKKQSLRPDFSRKVKAILAELSGLDLDNIKDDSELANIGIDSLMGMEMSREIESKFKCTLDPDELVQVIDIPGLMKCVSAALGVGNNDLEEVMEDEGDSDDDHGSDNPHVFTPSDSDTTTSTVSSENVIEHLVEFLGIERNEMRPDIVLRDLGVDSLLSTELRAELASKFDIEISEDVAIEEMTVDELDTKVNRRKISSGPVAAHENKGASVNSGNSSDSYQTQSPGKGLTLSPLKVLEAFRETKSLTDQFITNNGCSDYVKTVLPKKNDLCIALVMECFEEMGCSIRTSKLGQQLPRINHLPEHKRLVEYLYRMLEKEGRLVDLDGDRIIRTSNAPPTKSSKEILQDLLENFPEHTCANKLTYYASSHLAKVLTGTTNGIKLIFGCEVGRELVSGLYGDWPLNRLFYKQMEDFLARLVAKLPMHEGPLKILEVGAGTGGTTKWLVPLLASLNVPIEYTFTDLAPSFVTAARKKFKQVPFMKFRTHDIEKAPADDLLNSQHIIIASNAVHATHSLTASAANIRKALREDGFLMMLEMTGTLYWVDMIFGLFEGWWLFDDGRVHAVTNETRWERDLQSVGYGHIDWTDGNLPENQVEKIFIAMASGSRYERLLPSKSVMQPATDCTARQAVVDEYVRKMTSGFLCPIPGNISSLEPLYECVLLTGASGSVGSHLIASLVQLPHVKTIICLNRRSNQDPKFRQHQALISKGIFVTAEGLAKLKVFESDIAKPLLGLPEGVYNYLLETTTHVIHNAWLMSAKRPVKGFESQFQIMRNMIGLARDISSIRPKGSKVTFQFVSSIAVVGYYPLWMKNKNVPEERVTIDSVLPNGYGDAKYICELMLDETLHKHPDRFRTMSVRIGQIAGSKSTGYWNPMEHLSYLWKSSQTLKAVPNFEGLLSWTPVDDVAGTLVDLLMVKDPYPIYHIDNPIRQLWSEMIPVLADALDIPRSNAIPFADWIERVRNFPGLVESDNPASKLVDFLDANFLRMSCGGLLLETTKSREHSVTLRAVSPVSDEVARKFVQSWKDMRFLS